MGRGAGRAPGFSGTAAPRSRACRCPIGTCAACGERKVAGGCDILLDDDGRFHEWTLAELPQAYQHTEEQREAVINTPVITLLGLSQTGERVERRAALARVHSCHPVPREIRPGESEEDYRQDLRTINPPKWHLHSELVAPSEDAADGGGRVR